jgi:hypothetical protein
MASNERLGSVRAWTWPLIDAKSSASSSDQWEVRPKGLPVVPTAANRAPHRSQDPQDGADDQQDDPKRLEDPNPGEVAKEQQEQTENQHATASSAPTFTHDAPRYPAPPGL